MRTDSADAVKALQRVNEAGAKCWSGSDGFEDLRLIPELDTIAGRPRLLLLNRNRTQGLPLLVIEAHGEPVSIDIYGPLSGAPVGRRIEADVSRWSSGPLRCHSVG